MEVRRLSADLKTPIRAVTAGDAVLWPGGVGHAIWTEEEPLAAIVVDGPPGGEPPRADGRCLATTNEDLVPGDRV
jgi:hypothetical protein